MADTLWNANVMNFTDSCQVWASKFRQVVDVTTMKAFRAPDSDGVAVSALYPGHLLEPMRQVGDPVGDQFKVRRVVGLAIEP